VSLAVSFYKPKKMHSFHLTKEILIEKKKKKKKENTIDSPEELFYKVQ